MKKRVHRRKKSVLNKEIKVHKKKLLKKEDLEQIGIIIVILLLAFMAYTYSEYAGFKRDSIMFSPKEYVPSSTEKGQSILCTDSDSGLNYFLQGSLRVVYDSGSAEFIQDSCLNPKTLIENTCEGTRKFSLTQECEFGCYDGACLPQEEDHKILINENLSNYCGNVYFMSPKNAFASSDYESYSALDTLDFDADTHWFGSIDEPYPKWILFDLGERKCLSELDLYIFKRDLPTTFDLQVSNDQVRWKTIQKDISLTDISTIGIDFPSTTLARYIRIYQTSGVRPFGTLAEIRVGVGDFPEEILNG